MSRSTRQCRDRWIEVAHQRVNVEIDASMSRSMDRSGTSTRQCRDRRVEVEIDGSKWHINASMSRSTRRCRDRWIDLMLEQFMEEKLSLINRRSLSPEMQIC